MARRKKESISTMMGLLRAMTDEFESRKTGAVLKRFRSTPSEMYIEEYFDSGKGHSGALSHESADVAPELFDWAVAERYISGKLEPGYVSEWEFIITEFGKQSCRERTVIADEMLKQLSPGKGMRVCELRLGSRVPHVSEEVVQDILEWLMSEGYAESYEHGEQKFYLLVRSVTV